MALRLPRPRGRALEEKGPSARAVRGGEPGAPRAQGARREGRLRRVCVGAPLCASPACARVGPALGGGGVRVRGPAETPPPPSPLLAPAWPTGRETPRGRAGEGSAIKIRSQHTPGFLGRQGYGNWRLPAPRRPSRDCWPRSPGSPESPRAHLALRDPHLAGASRSPYRPRARAPSRHARPGGRRSVPRRESPAKRATRLTPSGKSLPGWKSWGRRPRHLGWAFTAPVTGPNRDPTQGFQLVS